MRPYRVGMSCGFCHVSANPEKPPADPEAPKWENLSSTAGAQYFWVDRILAWNGDQSNFLFQVLHTARPGSLDTSLVSTDNINNPRTMNAIYNLLPRLVMAKRWDAETLGQDNLANKQFNDFVSSGPLTQFFQPPNTVWTPHVLKDGSDSVGALGALNRVYLNIGLFSEEWLRHFNPVLGGKRVTPIQITTARANSSYWQATEATTPDMALFLLKASYPHRLKNAPGGSAYLNDPPATVQQGKLVFADNCAACHSSKMPDPPATADLGPSCIGPNYLACLNRYWAWTQTDDFHTKMRQIVLADDFLDGNYLSTDARVPVTLLQTNACSPLATNAIGGNIWDNFSSESYKSLPSVGTITVYDPFTGKPQPYKMPAGGRGYTRVPSLISLWATAPYLLNNSVGKFEAEPVGRGADDFVPGFDHPNAVAGKARQGRGARRQDPRRDRPHDRNQLAADSDRLPARRDQGVADVVELRRAGLRAKRGSRSARSRPARRSICWPISTRCPNLIGSARDWPTTRRSSRPSSGWCTICARCRRTPPTIRRGRFSPMSASSCSRSANARTTWSTAAIISAPSSATPTRVR